MAEPLLGGGHQPKPAPRVGAKIADAVAIHLHRRACGPYLARQSQQQFVLPIARHPGDAQYFAMAHRKADIFQRGAKRIG